VNAVFDVINHVNLCQIKEMQKCGEELDPQQPASCETFRVKVRNVQAAIIHTYQVTAFSALHEPDPKKAATLWMEMSELCNRALVMLKQFKEIYSGCGTPELYDPTLDYKIAADQRHYQNLEDAQCAMTPMPKGLFPKLN
jgi:hypothetical protein